MSGRRSWGWHRLRPGWAERLVAEADIRPGELVVDLGAGTGSLTLPLLAAGARVLAVELHPARAERLRRAVAGHDAVVLELDLARFHAPNRPFRLVSNPPYGQTAAVLDLVGSARHLTVADLLLQRGVVRQILAGERQSVVHLSAERGPDVPPSAFVPEPPVESAVVRLRRDRVTSARSGRRGRRSRAARPR